MLVSAPATPIQALNVSDDGVVSSLDGHGGCGFCHESFDDNSVVLVVESTCAHRFCKSCVEEYFSSLLEGIFSFCIRDDIYMYIYISSARLVYPSDFCMRDKQHDIDESSGYMWCMFRIIRNHALAMKDPITVYVILADWLFVIETGFSSTNTTRYALSCA